MTGTSDRLDELAQDQPASSPWEGTTEYVDARPEGDDSTGEDDRTVAQWFSQGNNEAEPGQIREVTPEQVVRQAGERAQRAIERQSVPRRHADVIKRVFDRLAKQAQEAQPAKPIVQDAEDAP